MKWIRYIIAGIVTVFFYFVFPPFFYLILVIIILYIIYRIYKIISRWRIPKGKRIKHAKLRGFLSQKYGKSEGIKIYKEMVQELRKDGYK